MDDMVRLARKRGVNRKVAISPQGLKIELRQE